jgi:hypothetical protein
MLFELIAVVLAGIAAGGTLLLLHKVAPALPRWLVPVVAGGAMIAAAVSLEYSWFGRTVAGLPDTLDVAMTHENSAPWRPWTYAAPYVDRFVAVDQATVRTNEAVEGQRMVDIYFFGRWSPVQRLQAVFDCEAGRRADIMPGVTVGENGAIQGATWHDTGLDDPLTSSACTEV